MDVDNLIKSRHPDLPEGWDVATAMVEIGALVSGFNADGTPVDVPLSQRKIAQMGVQLVSLLLEKNKNYGDAALNPLTVFAKNVTPEQKIRIRMDDKISRLARGAEAGEDVVFDFAGYSILLLIARDELLAKKGLRLVSTDGNTACTRCGSDTCPGRDDVLECTSLIDGQTAYDEARDALLLRWRDFSGTWPVASQ